MKLTVDNVVAARRRRSAFRIRAGAAGSVRAQLLLVHARADFLNRLIQFFSLDRKSVV